MFWESAPDQRMLRTLDWINEDCEAELLKKLPGTRTQPAEPIEYVAIMSAQEVEIERRHRRRPLRARWPITVLVTEDWLVVGTQKPLGRGARVRTFPRERLRAANPPHLRLSFWTHDEIDFVTTELTGVQTRRLRRTAAHPA